MVCNKCGENISEGSKFCNFCGSEIKSEANGSYCLSSDDKAKKDHNKLIIGIAAAIVLAIVTSIFYINLNPTKAAVRAIDRKNYAKMNDIYNKDIKGDIEKEKKVAEKVKSKLNSMVDEFKNNKLTYKEANNTLDEFTKLGLVDYEIAVAKKEITDLNDSRTSFIGAGEFENNGNYIRAIEEYNKVIEKDSKNYTNAKHKIEGLSNKYKEQVLTKAVEYEKEKDYKNAVSLINEALKVLPEDSDIKAKKKVFAELLEKQIAAEEKQKSEKAKNEQLISVEKTNILIQSNDCKSLYPDMFEVIIKNNSDKTIKSYRAAMLGWDKKGYPLKIKQNFLDNEGSYQLSGEADNVNVTKGSIYGKNRGWSLEEGHNISKTKAVIIEAEFYDDSTWENPYYKYFIDEFEGKPLEN